MKKIILFCTILFVFSSCDGTKTNTISDIEKIKVGMSENEVKYLLGEPEDVKIQNGYKILRFNYQSKSYTNWFYIYIAKDKVYNFES